MNASKFEHFSNLYTENKLITKCIGKKSGTKCETKKQMAVKAEIK